jgi:hypothetical protein
MSAGGKGWHWLTATPLTWPQLARIILKAAALFVLCNLIFAWLEPSPALGRISVYNSLVAGRPRLPFGEDPARAYNFSLFSVDAMFATHEVARAKPADEFRVLVMGDSGTWGVLLRPQETLAGQLNAQNLRAADGRAMRFYNLGYPTMSLTKDLLLLDYALRYQADAVVWVFTAQSFPRHTQLDAPLAAHNPAPLRALIAQYTLALDPQDARWVEPRTLWERSIIGQRRALADWLRLQLYGFAWSATQVDQYYPDSYTPLTRDYDTDTTWQGYNEGDLTRDDLALDVLTAGITRLDGVPFLLVNAPMYISDGVNSDLRYNFFYPRWAYDLYRAELTAQASANSWPLVDMWDQIAPAEFTDSPVHLTPRGAADFAALVGAQAVGQGW